MMIASGIAKKRLAAVWFPGAGLIFLVVLAASILPDGATASKLWTWFLPTVMPTLSLIVGVLVLDARGRIAAVQEVDAFLFRLAFGLSAFYLIIVALTLLLTPFSAELLDRSQLWLAPVQGLTSAALGAFFVQRDASAARNRRSTDRHAAAAATHMLQPGGI